MLTVKEVVQKNRYIPFANVPFRDTRNETVPSYNAPPTKYPTNKRKPSTMISHECFFAEIIAQLKQAKRTR